MNAFPGRGLAAKGAMTKTHSPGRSRTAWGTSFGFGGDPVKGPVLVFSRCPGWWRGGPFWSKEQPPGYPAITKSRPKNASTLIHAAGLWPKSSAAELLVVAQKVAGHECGLGHSSAACAAHRTRRRALEHSADYAARSADGGSGSSRTLRIMPSALCFSGRLLE